MGKSIDRPCKIIKIGNSKGVIIDKDTLDYLDLNIGDWVIITVEKAEKKESE